MYSISLCSIREKRHEVRLRRMPLFGLSLFLLAFITIFQIKAPTQQSWDGVFVPRTGLFHDPGYSCEGRTQVICVTSCRWAFLFVRGLKAFCNDYRLQIPLKAFTTPKQKSPFRYRGKGLVPRTGFEPAHLAALPPEDSASTNFATWADPS